MQINKVNRWSLELAICNITFEWISEAKNKASDCLSHLVEPTFTSTTVNMLTATHTDGPAFNTKSCTINTSPYTINPPPWCFTTDFSGDNSNPKTANSRLTGSFTANEKEQTHSVNMFPKWLLNGKSPQHEFDTFTHIKGLLYKHIMDSGKHFLPLLSQNLGSTQY